MPTEGLGPHPSRISIIVPTLNEEAYIGRFLRSVMAQEPRPLEVIVVDGGSQDRTVELARRLGAKVIEQPSNMAEAKNIGAQAARGDYLFFIDADSMLPPDFMEKVSRLGPVDCVRFRAEPLEMCFLGRLGCALNWILCRMWLSNTSGVSILIKKELFEAVGGFRTDLIYNEDIDFLRRVAKRAKILYPKDIYLFNSIRQWAEGNKLKLREILRNILRLAEYFLTRESSGRWHWRSLANKPRTS